MNKGSLISRRCDFTINAPIEKITKIANDPKHFYKIMHLVDNCTLISTHGDSSIFIVKLKPNIKSETPKETLIGSNIRLGTRYTTVVRSSVEMDSYNIPSEGFIRPLVLISGMMLYPSETDGITRVSSMCYVDTNKPYSSEAFKSLDSVVIDSAWMLKKNCETGVWYI